MIGLYVPYLPTKSEPHQTREWIGSAIDRHYDPVDNLLEILFTQMHAQSFDSALMRVGSAPPVIMFPALSLLLVYSARGRRLVLHSSSCCIRWSDVYSRKSAVASLTRTFLPGTGFAHAGAECRCRAVCFS